MKQIFKRIVVRILEAESRAVLKKYNPKIVGITGSVGKTSTKDAVNSAMSRFFNTRASKKSQNSEIGLPLTILGLKNASLSFWGWSMNIIRGLELILLPNHYPEWLVLEIGADAPGDIKSVTEWVKPDVVVVTKLSKVPVHVEAFDSPEDLIKEKSYLVTALKRGGALVLNIDDEDVLAYRNLSDERVILFGNAEGSDVRAAEYEVVYGDKELPTGIRFNVYHKDEVHAMTLLGTLGAHHAYHILAAAAVCVSLGEDLASTLKPFKHHAPTPGRMRLIEGIKDSIILDDTYNSSPVAAEEALKALQSLTQPKRRIAVLGDMLELGRYSVDEHKKIGVLAAASCDILVTVGVRSRYTAEAAQDAEMDEDRILQFDEAREAGAYIQNIIEAGDAVLVKGSQSMRMERVVEEIMQMPEDKEKLLVRNDEEWQKRG